MSVGHAECNKIIAMPNGGTQGVLHHFLRCHTALNVKISALNLTADAVKNPPNFMTLLNQGVPEVVHQQTTIMQSIMLLSPICLPTDHYDANKVLLKIWSENFMSHTNIYVTGTHQYMSLAQTNI